MKTSDFLCGDGTVDDGEDCDTTEDTATCDYDLGDGPQACTLAICSDGYLNTAAGETCDDGNVVAGDGCDATCQLECTSDADCTNNLFCDGVETCDASSTCQAGIPVNPDDGVSCTNDSCNEATDSIDNTPDDTVCDDGLFCTVGDICDATLDCQTGTPVNPDDGVLCTDDSCDEANDVLVNFANDANCDDNLFCSGTETCDATLDCQAGIPVNPDDGVLCTDDSCNEATDSIDNTPDDTVCDDANVCTGTETCDASLGCQAGTPLTCDDGLFCDGLETCDATSGCQAGTPQCIAENELCDETGDTCCILTGASWSHANVAEGTQVTLTVDGIGCNGLNVNFDIFEDDIGFGDATDDPSLITPPIRTFVSGSASATWTAEWQCDGISFFGFCFGGTPEWYFDASLDSSPGTTLRSSDPKLVVTEEPPSTCGNGFLQVPEACEFAGTCVDGSACGYVIGVPTVCGDGSVCSISLADSATCDYDLGIGPQACTLAECGDGYLNIAAGEQCDDSGTIPGDGCSATCQIEVATASACQDVPPSGATHFWLADGNAEDIVGSVTGTLNGAATYVDGVAGQAFGFNSASDTVVFDQTAAITGTDSYTIDFWVKSNVVPGSSTGLFAQGNSNIKFSFVLAGSMCFISELEGITESTICAGPDIMTDGNYHHIAGVRDAPNTKAILYVDGVEVWANSITNLADYPAAAVTLGAGINGAVDELGFYNRALTPTEILDIYNSGGAEVYLSASEDLTNLPNQNFNNFCWRQASIEEEKFSCTEVCQDHGGVAEATCDWRESPLTGSDACSYFNPEALVSVPQSNSNAPYFYDSYTTNNGYCYGARLGSSSSCTTVPQSRNYICTCNQPTSSGDCDTAGGYWDSNQNRCWIQGNYVGTCDDVCAPYGGIYVDPTSSGGCDWAAIQPADCAACIALNPGATCSGGSSVGPFYTPSLNNCKVRTGTGTSCSISFKYEKQCACNEEQVPSCGNGFIQSGETCDDGNTIPGDGCSATCQIECGDGIAQTGEQCDGGNADSATCNYDIGTGLQACTLAVCGDDYLNTAAGEQCDYGGDPAYACDATCQSPLVCQNSQEYTSCAAVITPVHDNVVSAADCQTICATEIDSAASIDSGCWIWDSAANTCSCGSGVGTPAATPTGSSGGLCQLCSGWWDGTYCWHEGEMGQSCSTVCVPFGGTFYENDPVSLGQCDWVNDETNCATCLHFNSGAVCTGSNMHYGPYYYNNKCYHDPGGSASCVYSATFYTRQCACNQ